jgi:hypothetical protein
MFAKLLYEKSQAAYEKHILLICEDMFLKDNEWCKYFKECGFVVVYYENDLLYRIRVEEEVKSGEHKILMIASQDVYIPYDVQKSFQICRVSITDLFPKLNSAFLRSKTDLDYDIISLAYDNLYDDLSEGRDTEIFLETVAYGKDNVGRYLMTLCDELRKAANNALNFKDWFDVAETKARIHVLSEQYGIPVHIEDCNTLFVKFVLEKFGKLSAEIDSEAPVLVSRAMEYISEHSEKFVLIVMDGMSEFDWRILSETFDGIKYEHSHSMAMIPTVTSVSRQCLLSDKFPRELENPWSQGKEKKEFTECAKRLGFSESQIAYGRGYDAEIGHAVKCAAIIINDIDDMVHGQKQGRQGMYHDVKVLAQTHRLIETVRRLLSKGFDVYISADHGNTPCTGMGKLMKTGVETETKSRRMIVLKDFADKESLLSSYDNLIEYPGYYLDKQMKYIICGVGDSFDAKGDEVMSHGGISLDEVIVPFIKIKAVENNG